MTHIQFITFQAGSFVRVITGLVVGMGLGIAALLAVAI